MSDSTAPQPPLGYAIAFLAAHGPISRSEIYEAIKRGDLKAKKYGRRTIVPHAAWDAFITSMPDYAAAA
ncbi:MerR family transcriptional regulator [Sphingobium chungbukense]|uniref:Helix-turn-helix domain-containing protein n=1 Tax=Sphingobium chungbukense TaxID=56193 RepID=A0A0M3ASW9_9SPHN|nr:helix-turn-helix domain-containing protein [Sphingobium chungbukense]KKW92950.1 hypothetical protein YP76_08690 [Sphingobium chungbukense]